MNSRKNNHEHDEASHEGGDLTLHEQRNVVERDGAMFRSVSMLATMMEQDLPPVAEDYNPNCSKENTLGGKNHYHETCLLPTHPKTFSNQSNHKSTFTSSRSQSMPVNFMSPTKNLNGGNQHNNDGNSSKSWNNTENTNTYQRWKVTKLHVPPMYYPIEMSAIVIKPPTTLDDIVTTINNFVRDHSISTVQYNYDDNNDMDESSGRLNCMTPNLVKFTIQLWKSVPSATEVSTQKPGIIVEIQRRSGCSIEMQKVRQRLIHILTNPDIDRDECINQNIHDNTYGPNLNDFACTNYIDRQMYSDFEQFIESTMNTTRERQKSQPTDAESDAWNISLALLQSQQLNQNLLGLESLTNLTDPYSVSKLEAQRTATRVLTDSTVHRLLRQYFINIEISPSISLSPVNNDDSDNTDPIDYQKGSFFGGMHVLALKILAQALDTWMLTIDDKALSGDDGTFKTSSHSVPLSLDVSGKFWEDVVTACLYNMKASAHRPLEASLSMHCLRLLINIVPEHRIKNLLHQGGRSPAIYRMINDARCYGHEHHRRLEHESEMFLSQLGPDVH